tara:strand:+ start:10099 stop:10473 length:375 start_codon:yes stop_codon:yes gene_type:complete
MKLTKRKLIQIIKEEVSAYEEEQLDEVDPAMVTGLQQAFLLNPRAFRMVWSLIQKIPSIPARWRELSAKEAEDKAASQDDPQLADLLNALGEFSESTGGEAFTDDEKANLQKVYRGDADASGRE